MAEHRPFPASARRRALARRAGLHAASPLLVGGAAAAAAIVAIAAIGASLARQLGDALAAACRGSAVLAPGDLAAAVLAAALPVLAAAAVTAAIAHGVQTRAAWLPRRRISGAPALDGGPGPRTRRAGFELVCAAAIGGVAFAWLWLAAPGIATLLESPHGAAHLVVGLAESLAIAWIALGVLDALARHAGLARALAMTATEKREDDRLAGGDPRWRAHRARVWREDPADAVAGASLLVLGDDAAVAVAWDPVRRPAPVRTATGRGPRATQLLGLARRHRIAVHRDPELAALLVAGDGAIPERHWPRLAEIVAATRRAT